MTPESANPGIRVLLRGGLGNQMFQYAAGLALARRHEVPLALDLALMDADNRRGLSTPRQYALAPFGVEANLASGSLRGRRLAQIVSRLLPEALSRAWVPRWFIENANGYSERFERLGSNTVLDGYFQSHRYFVSVENEVRTAFAIRRFSDRATEELHLQIAASEAIGIHVRRGDYVTNPAAARFHGVLDRQYYTSAIGLLRQDSPRTPVYVFSDDMTWCSESLGDVENIHFLDPLGRPPHEDIWLMSACRDFVIANSSFSWWAAWLGGHPLKRVIRPAHWFAEARPRRGEWLTPSTWELL